MTTRLLNPRERHLASLVSAAAFEGQIDYEKAKEEALALTDEEVEALLHPVPPEEPALPHERIPRKTWGTFDDDGTLFTSVGITPYTVRFAGHQVLMGGVGGVATLPTYRRRGGVRACMQAALQDMFAEDFCFSALFPFSSAYYSQYGYEKGAPLLQWTLPLAKIKPAAVLGKVRQLLPGDDLSPLTSIYDRFYENWNLSTVRRSYHGDSHGPKVDIEALFNKKSYIFVYENALGDPRGFMITSRDGRVMDCVRNFGKDGDMLFLDAEAFLALTNFIKSAFSADYDALRFRLPAGFNLDSLIPETRGTGCARCWEEMLRAVNVEKILAIARCRGEGSIVLTIEDDILPQNSGSWRISFAPGTENQVEKTSDAPDILLPIGSFSALICGVQSAGDPPMMPGVRVYDPSVPFEQIFYPQKCAVSSLF